MYRARRLFMLVTLTLWGTALHAQYSSIGTEFYAAFIQNRTLADGSASNGSGNLVRTGFYVSNHSFDRPTTVSITYNGPVGLMEYSVDGTPVPLQNGRVEFSVDPADGRMVEMIPANGGSAADMQVMGNGRVGSNSFTIRSDGPIALYGQSWQTMSRDVSLILPTSSLGSDYVVMAAKPTPTSNSKHGGPAEFTIVAVEENTVVRFTLPSAMTTKVGSGPVETIPAGEQEVTLHAGETCQVQTDSEDLSGLRVTADSCRPFALYAGNMAVKIPDAAPSAWDHVYEQMFPIRSWGRRYVTTTMTEGVWDLLKITASESGTTITIDGTELMTPNGPLRLAQGEVLEISDRVETSRGQTITNAPTSISRPTMIEGSAPIMVAAFGLSAGMSPQSNVLDPFMVILSPIEQGIGSITFGSLPAERRYLGIVTHRDNRGKVLISDRNGPPLSIESIATWEIISGTTFMHARVDLPAHFGQELTFRLTVIGDDPQGFNAYITGYNNLEGYGYAAGVNLDPLQGKRLVDRVICEGESVELEAAEGDAWRWESSGRLDCFDCRRPTATPEVGVTEYRVAIERGCVTIFDTMEVRVAPLPRVELAPDTILCGPGLVSLARRVEGTGRARWSPARDISCVDCINPTARPEQTTLYRLVAEGPTGCVVVDSVLVTVLPIPKAEAGSDAMICVGDSTTIGEPGATADDLLYRWTPSEGLSCDDCPAPIAAPRQSTTYRVNVTRGDLCVDIDSVRVEVTDSTLLTVAIPGEYRGNTTESIEIPVEVTSISEGSLVTDFMFTLRYDPSVVVVDPFSLFGKRERTLLAGWETRIVDRGPGTFTAHFFLSSDPTAGAEPLSTTGTLLIFDANIYLGRVTGSDLDISLSTPLPCNRVTPVPGRIVLDSICAIDFRLISIAFGRFVPPGAAPNPVRSQSRITFSIPFEAPTRLELIDAGGRVASALVEGTLSAGTHELLLDATRLTAGSYTLHLTWAGTTTTTRLVIRE